MILNRVRKILSTKKPSKKTFWKIGLFLVFAVGVMNVGFNSNFTDNNSSVAMFSFEKKAMANKITNFLLFGDTDRTWDEAKNGIKQGVKDSFGDVGNIFYSGAKSLLWGILQVIHWLVLASARLFDFFVDPNKSFNVLVRDNNAIYEGWAMVRDFLNLFFMLALLFSAFSTIFQVEKYHLKKIIILLIVMALLVNFSYPITLFVIDFSNSAMYFFVGMIQHVTGVNSASSESALVASMADMGMLNKAIVELADIPALIMSIIFQFILFVTIFAFAANLLIRILAFAILLVFAPAGFALSFFPSTSKVADSWWDSLFKYAVMGPLMIFFLLLANLMFNVTAGQQFNAPTEVNDLSFVDSVLVFVIPVAFLWIGMIASQKFSGNASSVAMGYAKRTGNKIKGYGAKAVSATYQATGASGVAQGIKQGYVAKFITPTNKRNEKIASVVASKFGDKNALENLERKKWEENKKKYANYESAALKDMLGNGDLTAADVLMDRKQLTLEDYNKVIEANERKSSGVNDARRREDLVNKFKAINKEGRTDIIASINARERINSEDGQREIATIMARNPGMSERDARDMVIHNNIQNTFGNLNKDTFTKQDWNKIADEITRKARGGNADEKAEARATRLAIGESFENMTDDAKAEIRKNMSQNQVQGLSRHGLNV